MEKLKNNQFERMKKGTVATLCVLMLAGSFASCGKRGESGGDVPYMPCPCEFNVESVTIKGNARLRIGTTAHTSFWEECISWVSNDDGESAVLWLNPNISDWEVMAIVDICNFPDFAKQWSTPEEGIDVYYEGIMYPMWCEEYRGGCRELCYSMILTKLKIK